MKTFTITLSLLFSMSTFALDGPYSIHSRVQLEGAEGWDCLSVDTSTNYLFVTRGNHIDVVDLKTEKVVGKISEHIDGAHAVAFVPNLNKGYITSGKSAKVVTFDLKSLKVLKEIPAGKKADIILFDNFTSRIFSFNGEESITVIDTNNDTVLKTIKIEGKPEFAVTDEKGNIYFNNENKSSIIVLDAKKMTVKKTWPLEGCKSPTGLSADFTSRRLFSVCDNEVMAITNIDTGKVIKTLPIGKGPDGSMFDDGLAFSSNGSGSLTVIKETDANKFEVLQNLETQKGARTMTIDPKTHAVYLLTAKYEAADPKATTKQRPKIIPGSVELLVIRK